MFPGELRFVLKVITKFKRADIAKLLSGEETFAQELSLIADKVRVVWSALGYTNWTTSFEQADDCVEKLFMEVLEQLRDYDRKDEDYACAESQCLEVNAQFDEDGSIVVDYYFRIV